MDAEQKQQKDEIPGPLAQEKSSGRKVSRTGGPRLQRDDPKGGYMNRPKRESEVRCDRAFSGDKWVLKSAANSDEKTRLALVLLMDCLHATSGRVAADFHLEKRLGDK